MISTTNFSRDHGYAIVNRAFEITPEDIPGVSSDGHCAQEGLILLMLWHLKVWII